MEQIFHKKDSWKKVIQILIAIEIGSVVSDIFTRFLNKLFWDTNERVGALAGISLNPIAKGFVKFFYITSVIDGIMLVCSVIMYIFLNIQHKIY
jgi:hypothetical protein